MEVKQNKVTKEELAKVCEKKKKKSIHHQYCNLVFGEKSQLVSGTFKYSS